MKFGLVNKVTDSLVIKERGEGEAPPLLYLACVDIQYAVAVSIHNVIHIFRDLHTHTPGTRVFLQRVYINARVDRRNSRTREREHEERKSRARVDRIRVSRKRNRAWRGEQGDETREHTSCRMELCTPLRATLTRF